MKTAFFMAALRLGFSPEEAGAIGIIGGADGPTAIFLSSKLAPDLMGAIAVSAYSYMLGLSVYLSFSVLIIDFFVVIYLLAGFRILARYIVYRIKTGNKNIDFNVVIFGHA